MKIVVPNVTVGMIIGRGGCYIKQIKDDSGAYVQISQKAPDTLLVERVVTIGGLVHFLFYLNVSVSNEFTMGCCNPLSYL
jgi:hypothetical protein